MSVYMIIEIEILDRETYVQYIAQVPPIVKKYGGRYLARGEEILMAMGDWHPQRVILLEFPSLAQVQKWLASPEYALVAPLRTRSTKSKAIVIESCSEP